MHVLWGLAKLSALQAWRPAEPLLQALLNALHDALPELGACVSLHVCVCVCVQRVCVSMCVLVSLHVCLSLFVCVCVRESTAYLDSVWP